MLVIYCFWDYRMHRKLSINGKSVYIVEDHHHVLVPWRELAEECTETPFLISFDYHTDTRKAFSNYAYSQDNSYGQIAQSIRSSLCASMNKDEPNSIENAISYLKHDEHMDAAIVAKIISHSFVIQFMDPSGTESLQLRAWRNEMQTNFKGRLNNEIPYPAPPFTYQLPENKIFLVPNICAVGCSRAPHNDQCLVDHADQALEDIYIKDKMTSIRQMAQTTGLGMPESTPFILDIDLDYFRTAHSIEPEQTQELYALIRNSVGITIARECTCVEMLKFSGENIDCNMLEIAMLEHIRKATSS